VPSTPYAPNDVPFATRRGLGLGGPSQRTPLPRPAARPGRHRASMNLDYLRLMATYIIGSKVGPPKYRVDRRHRSQEVVVRAEVACHDPAGNDPLRTLEVSRQRMAAMATTQSPTRRSIAVSPRHRQRLVHVYLDASQPNKGLGSARSISAALPLSLLKIAVFRAPHRISPETRPGRDAAVPGNRRASGRCGIQDLTRTRPGFGLSKAEVGARRRSDRLDVPGLALGRLFASDVHSSRVLAPITETANSVASAASRAATGPLTRRMAARNTEIVLCR